MQAQDSDNTTNKSATIWLPSQPQLHCHLYQTQAVYLQAPGSGSAKTTDSLNQEPGHHRVKKKNERKE